MLLDVPELPSVDNSKHSDALYAAYPCATRCAKGTYGLVYFLQAEQSLRVDLSCLSGRVKAGWFDPRNGKFHDVVNIQIKL
ncbi:MAG: hypothetical protein HY865_11810 [Chloroflexi bacterium]|nr:hypothetical protein [Chloroflexota bacterium]